MNSSDQQELQGLHGFFRVSRDTILDLIEKKAEPEDCQQCLSNLKTGVKLFQPQDDGFYFAQSCMIDCYEPLNEEVQATLRGLGWYQFSTDPDPLRAWNFSQQNHQDHGE